MKEKCFQVTDYDLAATLACGQAFRWRLKEGAWEGVIGSNWVRLSPNENGFKAQVAQDISDWGWLEDYLQTKVSLQEVLFTFPQDEPLSAATAACRGLRLVKQEPWECLASFILSSTKQIVQIQQIVELLCAKYGGQVQVPAGNPPTYAFPAAARLAQCSEAQLRELKMGFRAKYLHAAANAVASGELNLDALHTMTCEQAREELMKLPGVGRKIADCVLLFAYGFQAAFPVDVWVQKALHALYFPKRKPSAQRLTKFIGSYFGPYSGYAQQYLFHYMRTQVGRGKTKKR